MANEFGIESKILKKNFSKIHEESNKKLKLNKKDWTFREDEAINQLVQQYGTKKWALVSKMLLDKYRIKGRSGKQCRERWFYHLNPDVNKTPLSDQEEIKLFQSYKSLGTKWAEIAQQFNGKTDNLIKNHFYTCMRREFRRLSKATGINFNIKTSELTFENMYHLMKTNHISLSIIDNLNIKAILKDLDTDSYISNIPSDLVLFSKKRFRPDSLMIRRSERIQKKKFIKENKNSSYNYNCNCNCNYNYNSNIQNEEPILLQNEEVKSEVEELNLHLNLKSNLNKNQNQNQNQNQTEKNKISDLNDSLYKDNNQIQKNPNIHEKLIPPLLSKISEQENKVSIKSLNEEENLLKYPESQREKIFVIIKNAKISNIKEQDKPKSIKNEEVEEFDENPKEIKCFSKVRNNVPSLSLNIEALPKFESRPTVNAPFSQLIGNIAGSSRNSNFRPNYDVSPNTYFDLNFPSPFNFLHFQYSPFYSGIHPYNFTPIYSTQNIGRYYSPLNPHFRF